MRRTIYINDVLVDDSMLNNTENSKISEILRHHNSLGSEGIISGLNVIISAQNNANISVTSGKAVLLNREIVELKQGQNNLQLADTSNGAINIVLISYREEFTVKKPNEIGNMEYYSRVNTSAYVDIKTVDEYLALPDYDIQPQNQSKDKSLIIGIVTGAGSGIPLSSESITIPQQDTPVTNFLRFNVLNNLIVKDTNIPFTTRKGYIRYGIVSKKLRFLSPNSDSSLLEQDLTSNSLQLNSGNNLENFILTDQNSPNDFLILDIFQPLYPKSINSLDINSLPGLIQEKVLLPIFRNPTVNTNVENLTANELQSLIDRNAFKDFIINEPVNFTNLYQENVTSTNAGVDISVNRASSVDRIHREKTGDGKTNTDNPHGLSLDNILRVFDSFKGAIRIGDSLSRSGFDSLTPRLITPTSSRTRYTLLFETKLQDATPAYPVRVYINSRGNVDNEENPGITLTINARWSPSQSLWIKDDSSENAVKLLISNNSFNFHFEDSMESTVNEAGWGTPDFETNETYTRILRSIGIIPKSNNSHNSSFFYSALLNTSINNSARPNKVLFFEDKNSNLGDLRIYLGQDQNLRDFITQQESELVDELGNPVLEDVTLPNETIDFTINAKPVLGTINWEKDNTLPSYMLRYRFSDGSLSAYRYTPIGTGEDTFVDSQWELVTTQINTTISVSSSSVIAGNFTINDSDVLYSNPKVRSKAIPVREIGFNSSRLGASAAYPTLLGDLMFDDSYMEWRRNDLGGNLDIGTLNFGGPQRVVYENRGRNGRMLDSPRYVWTGTDRPKYRGRKDDTGATLPDRGDTIIVGFSDINGVFRFLIPLFFKERRVSLREIVVPIDLSGVNYSLAQWGFPQTLQFSGALGNTSWYSLNLWDTNVVTGEAQLVSPPNSSVRITHDGSDDSDYRIIIRSSSGSTVPFITLDKSLSPWGNRSVVYLHLTSSMNTVTSLFGGPTQLIIPGTSYNYWHIGSPVVIYETTNL